MQVKSVYGLLLWFNMIEYYHIQFTLFWKRTMVDIFKVTRQFRHVSSTYYLIYLKIVITMHNLMSVLPFIYFLKSFLDIHFSIPLYVPGLFPDMCIRFSRETKCICVSSVSDWTLWESFHRADGGNRIHPRKHLRAGCSAALPNSYFSLRVRLGASLSWDCSVCALYTIH